MQKQDETWTWVAVLIIAYLLLSGGGGGTILAPTKATAATYFYEKDSGGVPPEVGAAIGKLNELGITATTHEDDATNSGGQIPKQYAVSLPAAREAGLPALVVMANDKVLRTVKDPKTEAQVLEAAK